MEISTSGTEIVVIHPKRYHCRPGGLSADPDEQYATGEAAVEQQRERHVAVRVAAFADHLDQSSAPRIATTTAVQVGEVGQQPIATPVTAT